MAGCINDLRETGSQGRERESSDDEETAVITRGEKLRCLQGTEAGQPHFPDFIARF